MVDIHARHMTLKKRKLRGADDIYIWYERKNRRASRALFFIIELCQAKVVAGVHGNKCIRHGIASGARRFRPKLAGAGRSGVKTCCRCGACLCCCLDRFRTTGSAGFVVLVECCVLLPPILPGLHWLYVRALTKHRSASVVEVSIP